MRFGKWCVCDGAMPFQAGNPEKEAGRSGNGKRQDPSFLDFGFDAGKQ
jgi:hypothetical protein